MPKRTRKSVAHSKNPAALLLIILGLLLTTYSGLHFYLRHQALSLSRDQLKQLQVQSAKQLAEPTHVFIQWFVDVDVETLPLVNNSWGISPTKATFLSQSARPGENGNIILYGHNTRQILGNIRALKGGETIVVTTQDGVTHRYEVQSTYEVQPNNVSLLQPTNTEVLTIYTCSGPLDSLRFIVRAVPITEEKK